MIRRILQPRRLLMLLHPNLILLAVAYFMLWRFEVQAPPYEYTAPTYSILAAQTCYQAGESFRWQPQIRVTYGPIAVRRSETIYGERGDEGGDRTPAYFNLRPSDVGRVLQREQRFTVPAHLQPGPKELFVIADSAGHAPASYSVFFSVCPSGVTP